MTKHAWSMDDWKSEEEARTLYMEAEAMVVGQKQMGDGRWKYRAAEAMVVGEKEMADGRGEYRAAEAIVAEKR